MWETIEAWATVAVLIFAMVCVVALPPLYMYGVWKQEKYREHGRRTGEW